MFDAKLRLWKDRLLAPLLGILAPFSPTALTLVALGLGLVCVAMAALGWGPWALIPWVLNRIFDGLDGLQARATGRQTDQGGYLDLVSDFLIYALIPLSCAWSHQTTGAWMAVALFLGSCYLNACSWMTLSALLEKRGASGPPGATSLVMPRGLMEGFETIVLFGLLLSLPWWTTEILLGGAALVFLSFLLRAYQGLRLLKVQK